MTKEHETPAWIRRLWHILELLVVFCLAVGAAVALALGRAGLGIVGVVSLVLLYLAAVQGRDVRWSTKKKSP